MPPCHGTGWFVAPPRKWVHILGTPKKRPLESPKWHWLFLPPIGANVHVSWWAHHITTIQYISLTYMSLIFSPRTTPIERSTMKGLLRPKLDLHLSDNDPKIGVRKKPMSGDKHQISVMCSWRTPETKEIISSHLNMNRLFFQMLLLLLDGRVVGGNISSIGPQNVQIKVFLIPRYIRGG